MLNQAAFAVAAFRRGFGRIDPEELRYGAEISIWVRWFGVAVCLVIVTYQGDHSEFSYLLDILFHLVPVAVNGYVHYRIRTNRAVTWYWLLALSVMDLAQASIGTAITGGFVSPFFVFCFPAVSVFASVFTSPRISFSWTTLVAPIYTGLCLVVAPGLDFDGRDEVVLFARLAALYSVSVTVNLITRSGGGSAGERRWSGNGNCSGSASSCRSPFMTPWPSPLTWSAWASRPPLN